MKLLLALISIVMDVFLLNIYRVTSLNLNYFYPMFTITFLVYICNLYSNPNRKYYYYYSLMFDCLETDYSSLRSKFEQWSEKVRFE